MGKYASIAFWAAFFGANNGFSANVLSALFIISFTESCCFIIPPDFFLPFLAFGKPLWAVAALTMFTVFASVCGAAAGYFIGIRGGRPLLDKWFKKEKTEKAEQLFQKYDVWAIAVAAFTPIPYKVFTITAGVFKMHFGKFLIVSAIARGARYMLIAMISYVFLKDKTPQDVSNFLHSRDFAVITVAIAGGVILIYVLGKLFGKRKPVAA